MSPVSEAYRESASAVRSSYANVEKFSQHTGHCRIRREPIASDSHGPTGT